MTGRIECEWDRLLTDEGGAVTLSFRALNKEAAKRLAAKIRAIQGEKREKPPTFDVSVDRHREKRSRDANAYFHVLVEKIAEAMRLGNDEVKRQMVLEYGSAMLGEDGNTVCINVSRAGREQVASAYPYAKWTDERYVCGVTYDVYTLYNPTHVLDSKEMSRLIEGTVYEAKELGIETITPKEIEQLLSSYGGGKRNDKV